MSWLQLHRFMPRFCFISFLLIAFSAYGQPEFGPPFALNTLAATDANEDNSPDVATDGNGHWVAVWHSTNSLNNTIGSDFDILVARSSSNGSTWSAPIALNTNAGMDSGKDFDPVIATDGDGNWVCAWHSEDTLGGLHETEGDILCAHSTDDGATWSGPTRVNADAANDERIDAYPQLTTNGNGMWIAVWPGQFSEGGDNGSDGDIYFARSIDNGATWFNPKALNSNADEDSGNDLFPVIETDRGGNWIAAWISEGWYGGDGDIAYARSVDNGANWTEIAPLNSDANSDGDGDGEVTLATDRNGNWVATWYSRGESDGPFGEDVDIKVAFTSDNGANWSDPDALNSDAATDSQSDYFPCVATDTVGLWIVVWTHTGFTGGPHGADNDLFWSTSTDNGETWSEVSPFNSNGTTDSGGDTFPVVTTDEKGHWIVAWQSLDSLGGTLTPDGEIFAATGSGLTDASLTIVSPNGGEKWRIGKKRKIEWISTGNTGNKVKLELYRNGVLIGNIKASTKNDGKQRWAPPDTLEPGKGYKIRIISKSDPGISDASNGNFKIKSPN